MHLAGKTSSEIEWLKYKNSLQMLTEDTFLEPQTQQIAPHEDSQLLNFKATHFGGRDHHGYSNLIFGRHNQHSLTSGVHRKLAQVSRYLQLHRKRIIIGTSSTGTQRSINY